MQLTDEQKQKVAAWIADGMSLSDIQDRMRKDFEIHCTYMEARLLVDDLKLTPKDLEPPAPPAAAAAAAPPSVLADAAPAPSGKVALSVDQIARAGTMVSGSVKFSDGKSAQWHLDQQGRLAVVPAEQGYRPAAGDVEEFQAALDRELQKLGY